MTFDDVVALMLPMGNASEISDILRPPSWHADALCREYPGEWWFPERGQSTAPAKQVCGRCLAFDECRAWALAQGPELQGIWAALSTQERSTLRRAAA